jgi:hypothetical protein
MGSKLCRRAVHSMHVPCTMQAVYKRSMSRRQRQAMMPNAICTG